MSYPDRVRSARRWVAGTVAINLALLAGLLNDLHGRSGESVWRGLAVFLAAYVAFLVAYAVLVRQKPRPWLTLGVLALAIADWVVWFSVMVLALDPTLMLASLPGKLGLLWSLGRLAAAERRQLREVTRPSRLDPVLGLTLALAGVLGATPNLDAGAKLRNLQRRAKWARECRYNLKSWHVAERSYFSEHDTYSEDMERVGFAPERGNRYAYFASREGPVQARGPQQLADGPHTGVANDQFKFRLDVVDRSKLPPGLQVGLTGACPDHCAIAAACAAQFDGDSLLDVWSISTERRRLPDGGAAEAGVPLHEQDGAGLE